VTKAFVTFPEYAWAIKTAEENIDYLMAAVRNLGFFKLLNFQFFVRR